MFYSLVAGVFPQLATARIRSSLLFCDTVSTLRQDIQQPSRRTLQRHAVEIDLATMVFCRRHMLTPNKAWSAHLRIDASPQYGREYLVAELDFIPLQGLTTATTLLELARKNQVRLLQLRLLGSRAMSTPHKMAELLEMLRMESADLACTLCRVYTLLSDMGAEAGLWSVPNAPEGDTDDTHATTTNMFCRSLAISDMDHALHHATVF